ncbi:MAG TPA: amino acid racemase [Rhodothermales bacterium]|nr:aspartate racemase [Bacteroidota bacterium]HRK73852.1 amino acid racemase [Rhodothermales bacterium]HRR09274.1 amino acid racemase [Rhodothermales bacterium]
MNEHKIIGILGGLGPAAGADLFNKIIEETVATCDQDHPSVALLSYSDQIPDRATYIRDQTMPNPVQPMWDVLMHLQAVGASVAAIPCITAHVPVIFGVLRNRLSEEGHSMHLLSIIEETIRFIQVQFPNIQYVGAISTWTTKRNKLFEQALTAAGLTFIPPDDFIQDGVEAAIYDPQFGIKAVSNPVHPQARENLVVSLRHLQQKGAEAVILGCTELPIGIPEAELEGVKTIDPTRALGRALVAAVAPDKLRPLS